ncbi:MAG: radical SAM protein [Desulfurivibrio sp.]|nr:radical SAM protein [Desulfurivibrio sp.]
MNDDRPHPPRTLFFKPGERNIFFHLLTACNLSCRHCYINPAQHGRGMVSREEIDHWLARLAAPEQQSNVVFLGGEPSLHPELLHGVRQARRLGYQGVTIDTNGMFAPELLNQLDPAEAVLSFSLDGPDPASNDAIRGAGVFATATANLRRAVAAGFDVSLIFTASRLNIDQLPRMPALLAALGCRRFFIQVIGLRGRSASTTTDPDASRATPGEAHPAAADDHLQLSFAQWREIVPVVAADAAARGIHTIYPKVYLEPEDPFACAGRLANNFFIFPNGRVYLCPLCEDLPFNALRFANGQLLENPGVTERALFTLDIPEGCVMNKLLQPGNIDYDPAGRPRHRISCCLLKQEIRP